MELSGLVSFVFMLVIFPLMRHEFVEAVGEHYERCKGVFQCGNAKVNVSYPFYDGQIRPQYCGYPGFQIVCSDSDAYPEIPMGSETYDLLSVDENSDTVSVVRKSFWDSSYCPQDSFNADLNLTLYKYASTNENLTLFYNCSESSDQISTLSAYQFRCHNNTSSYNNKVGYFLPENFDPSLAQLLHQTCPSNITLPIVQNASMINTPRLAEAFQYSNYGFGVEWIAANNLCDVCHDTGGACGYNATRFTCYCPDGSYGSDCSGSSSKKAVIIGVSIGGGLVAALLAACLFICRRRKRVRLAPATTKDLPRPASLNMNPPSSNGFNSSQGYTTSPSTYRSQSTPSYPSSKSDLENNSSYHGVKLFSYGELEQATENFNESRELGDGGFGTVYYGELYDGRVVAVKRLYENSVKRMGQFMNEVQILARLRHDNLVTLFGCTSKRSRDLLLVYEYIPNGTVADHLHGKHAASNTLPWSIRLSIAVETAEALSFLHDNDVIHRDVKTNNILLDNDFKVKVADFGLSRLFPNDVTHVSTAPQGTPGYVDPDYYQCYRLTEKSDVYSFGVVLVELISSKMAVDITRHRHDINLANMAIDRIQKHAVEDLVDPHLGYDKDYDVQKMVKLTAELAFQCLQQGCDMRPSMKEVLESLRMIQKGAVNAQKQVVVDIQESDDDAGLLKNAPPPFSPETEVK